MRERRERAKNRKDGTRRARKLYATGGEMPTALTTFGHDVKTESDRQRIESMWIREIW